jgi:hypothetical protein
MVIYKMTDLSKDIVEKEFTNGSENEVLASIEQSEGEVIELTEEQIDRLSEQTKNLIIAKNNSKNKNSYNKEYYQKNKETIKENLKKYRESHKEQIAEYKKKYREENIDKIREAESKRENTEERKNYKKEYRKKKVMCECGVEITNGSKNKHVKSKGHLAKLSLSGSEDLDKMAAKKDTA